MNIQSESATIPPAQSWPARFSWGLGSIAHYCTFYAALPIMLVVCIGYTLSIAARYDQDSSAIVTGAAVIMASMAGLTFGYARCFNEKDPLRASMLYAGERFFQASTMLLFAAVVKYLSFHTRLAFGPDWLQSLVNWLAAEFIAMQFFVGVVMGYLGGRIIINHLTDRVHKE